MSHKLLAVSLQVGTARKNFLRVVVLTFTAAGPSLVSFLCASQEPLVTIRASSARQLCNKQDIKTKLDARVHQHLGRQRPINAGTRSISLRRSFMKPWVELEDRDSVARIHSYEAY